MSFLAFLNDREILDGTSTRLFVFLIYSTFCGNQASGSESNKGYCGGASEGDRSSKSSIGTLRSYRDPNGRGIRFVSAEFYTLL
ncbi:hypothetical protein RRG08_048619 [Elysia crispata]|uniref:Uncharacterized protein n=1 Tax=Elysia crispata TaxID=231223 RepID=A0AAE1ACU3_9GAST|nr:hypothetical protein RRG08_048619 [Elysia crispata]